MELIAAFVEAESESDARDLVTYLRTDLLLRPPEEIEDVWDSCGSDLFFQDTAGSLQVVADTIDAALAERRASD